MKECRRVSACFRPASVKGAQLERGIELNELDKMIKIHAASLLLCKSYRKLFPLQSYHRNVFSHATVSTGLVIYYLGGTYDTVTH